MARPAALNDAVAYGSVWDGQLQIGPNVRNPGRGNVTKNFHAYVENYEQCAHDGGMAEYVRFRGGSSRSPHDAQVAPDNNFNRQTPQATLTYYQPHGQVAATVVAAYMHQRWTSAASAGGNATVFQPGQKYSVGAQRVPQANGFCYDITMWYDVGDVYLAFHCYHR